MLHGLLGLLAPGFLQVSSGGNFPDTGGSFEDSGGQVDEVAYFFQRSFLNLGTDGCLGLLATQTVCQGSTKTAALEYVLRRGGTIYNAHKRIPWPGGAAVSVSRVHVARTTRDMAVHLNGKSASRVSAFLIDSAVDSAPNRLATNGSLAFMGYYPYGDGFLFEDGAADASPIAEMDRLLVEHPATSSVVHPYIGGDEFLSSPTQSHNRYAIFLRGMSETEAREAHPKLMDILEQKVKPKRQKNRRARLAEQWWRYGEERPGLYEATRGMPRMLMHPYVSKYVVFGFVPAGTLIASPHYAFASDSYGFFATMQCRLHDEWVRFFASSLEDRITYTAGIGFETFPLPIGFEEQRSLITVGQEYDDYRAQLMLTRNEGLTDTYNRFHDPNEHSPDILKLRELHAAMDRAVLDAYGWTDISTDCDFFLDYEIDEETWGNKKKPYRYRWPDEVHDEVLARLLELNQKRYEEEVNAGLHGSSKKSAAKSTSGAKRKTTAKKSSKKTATKKKPENLSLFGGTEAEDKA